MNSQLRSRYVPIFLLMATASSVSPIYANHILGYHFNETGSTATADGSAADPNGNPLINFKANGGAAADLHGGPGSGVSGHPEDRAFNNTNSSGIFGASHGEHASDFDPIDSFTAFTLGGWFFVPDNGPATESIGRQATLIENAEIRVTAPATGGYSLTGAARADEGALRLRVNEVSGVESAPGTYAEVGEWVNFAVTYDSVMGSVQFYKGLIDQPLQLVDTKSYNQGAVVNVPVPLTLGVMPNSGLTFNPFSGLLDNIRIWGEVVPLAALETLRQTDAGMSNVPEPTSLVTFLLGCISLAALRRN